MSTPIRPSPITTEHVYDPTIVYKPGKLVPIEEGATLSVLAQTAKKTWAQQKAFVYEENPKELRQEKVLAERILLKAIPYQDGREQIKKTTEWPHSIHAQLTIKFNGQTYGGSGALVGPHHLLTCGHNVYDTKLKQWADNITVYPALNGIHAPFGAVKVVRVYTFRDWTDREDKKYDLALLILDLSVGKFTGWGGLLCTLDDLLAPEEVSIVGYPGDKGMKQMWGMKHKIQKITPEEFEYLIDTNSGQSGSAICINKFGNSMILGVHTLGGDDMNYGVRLSLNKFKAIIQKISETYKLEKPDTTLSISAGLPAQSDDPLSQRVTSVGLSSDPLSQGVSSNDFAWPRKLLGDVDSTKSQTSAVASLQQPNLISFDDSITATIAPQATAPTTTLQVKPTASSAFGPDAWKIYLGNVGVAKPLPANIEQILNSPCPFWPNKTVRETHMLVYKPEIVNGMPLSLDFLAELVKAPQQGYAIKHHNFYTGYYLTNTPSIDSYWFLMTRDVIPGSRNISFDEQEKLLASYNKKAKGAYVIPHILDATIAICSEKVRYGTLLFRRNPAGQMLEATRCQEVSHLEFRGFPLGVGWQVTMWRPNEKEDDNLVIHFMVQPPPTPPTSGYCAPGIAAELRL